MFWDPLNKDICIYVLFHYLRCCSAYFLNLLLFFFKICIVLYFLCALWRIATRYQLTFQTYRFTLLIKKLKNYWCRWYLEGWKYSVKNFLILPLMFVARYIRVWAPYQMIFLLFFTTFLFVLRQIYKISI